MMKLPLHSPDGGGGEPPAASPLVPPRHRTTATKGSDRRLPDPPHTKVCANKLVCKWLIVSFSSNEEATFSLSFHTTPLSSPFLTLPPVCPTEEKVAWPVERGDEVMGGLRSLVVRLWIQVPIHHLSSW